MNGRREVQHLLGISIEDDHIRIHLVDPETRKTKCGKSVHMITLPADESGIPSLPAEVRQVLLNKPLQTLINEAIFKLVLPRLDDDQEKLDELRKNLEKSFNMITGPLKVKVIKLEQESPENLFQELRQEIWEILQKISPISLSDDMIRKCPDCYDYDVRRGTHS